MRDGVRNALAVVALIGTAAAAAAGAAALGAHELVPALSSSPRAATAVTTGGTHGDGYDRALFGARWADVDRNGCDTRNDVLARDLTDEVLAADGCTVLSGTLVDPYTGQRVLFQRQSGYQPVQVDHVYDLHGAWHAGAHEWTPEQRLAFANDTSNLLATTLNATKGDRSPAQLLAASTVDADKWDPSPEGFCRYARAHVITAAEWQLATHTDDRGALSTILRECA